MRAACWQEASWRCFFMRASKRGLCSFARRSLLPLRAEARVALARQRATQRHCAFVGQEPSYKSAGGITSTQRSGKPPSDMSHLNSSTHLAYSVTAVTTERHIKVQVNACLETTIRNLFSHFFSRRQRGWQEAECDLCGRCTCSTILVRKTLELTFILEHHL